MENVYNLMRRFHLIRINFLKYYKKYSKSNIEPKKKNNEYTFKRCSLALLPFTKINDSI